MSRLADTCRMQHTLHTFMGNFRASHPFLACSIQLYDCMVRSLPLIKSCKYIYGGMHGRTLSFLIGEFEFEMSIAYPYTSYIQLLALEMHRQRQKCSMMARNGGGGGVCMCNIGVESGYL